MGGYPTRAQLVRFDADNLRSCDSRFIHCELCVLKTTFCTEWPTNRRADKKCDEIALSHSLSRGPERVDGGRQCRHH
jgi:hypothetical protein